MFRHIVQKSPDCHHAFEIPLFKAVNAARKHDATVKMNGDAVPRSILPNGFVFHESRCGSTLVANTLAAVNPEKNRVYTESAPLIMALRACEYGCRDHEVHIALIRDVVYMMGRTNDINESRLFFKVQSVGTPLIHLVREAFPSTPWVFVYRDPVQVMMSHLKDQEEVKRGRAVCLRDLKHPSRAIRNFVEEQGESIHHISNEEFCAAHMAILCNKAIENNDASETGLMLDYDDIANKLMDNVLPNHFNIPVGYDERKRIEKVCGTYSKGMRGKVSWVPDNEKKENMATDEVKQASKKFLAPSYARLQLASRSF